MANKILQIVKVNPEIINEIKPSFNNLPETDHADGHYRLRKYSKVAVAKRPPSDKTWPEDNYVIKQIDDSVFTQSKKYNTHQGGTERKFEFIDKDVIESKTMYELLSEFYDACDLTNDMESSVVIDIHQMRIICRGGATQTTPEGWHQDGFNCVAIIGIDRCNIIGGELMAATDKTEPPFMKAPLDSGTMLIVDDDYLWHNGTSIQPIDAESLAYFDALIFTVKR